MSRAESGSRAVTLKELAALDAFSPPPYDFDEFTRRDVRARRERRVLAFSAAASVAALAVLVSVALRESGAPSLAQAVSIEQPLRGDPAPVAATGSTEPALVEVDRYALRSDLEDRIAWFDAALSTGRIESVPDEALLQMESTRAQLARSLQHVTYAHALLDH